MYRMDAGTLELYPKQKRNAGCFVCRDHFATKRAVSVIHTLPFAVDKMIFLVISGASQNSSYAYAVKSRDLDLS